MPRMNINSGAPGNPLDALLAGRNLYGNAGGLLYLNQYGGNNGMYSLDGSTPEGMLINDPRFFERYTTSGSEAGGGETAYRLNKQTMDRLNGRVQLRNTNIGGPGEAIDPSLVEYDPELGLLTSRDNIKPISNAYGDLVFALGAAGLALPTAFAAMGAGAGAGGSGSMVGNAGMEGYAGAFDAGGFSGTALDPTLAAGGGGSGLGAGAGLSELPYVQAGTLDPMATLDPAVTGGGSGFSGLGSGGLDPETMGGAGGMGNAASGGTYTGPPIGGDGGGSLLDKGIDWVKNNPRDAARLGMGLYSLGAAGGGGGGGHGGGSDSDPMSIIDQMANANRVNQSTPYGSRTWTQDANGRWTATDAYTPALQANFDNLTGMNGEAISGARQRLAELLTKPARRYDDPISFMIHGGK